MRTGGYPLQQSLTAEATNIVKQAVSLARRRGHAQVTPLHVANAMLASSASLFRRACLQSHTHPLQCKALEVCFNVALNRLPTSTSSPLLAPHSHLPSLSNALVAAFKRAQAHQRRGSIENQQQPILALKVEIEQLVISILDDPSVSRVMREAGFSSTQVKTKVEQAVSLENRTSHNNSPAVSARESKESIKPLLLRNCISSPTLSSSQFRLSLSRAAEQARDDDVMSIVSSMMNKRTKNTVIVGECPATGESVIKGVIDKFDKGNVPGEMRSVQFISVPLFTLRNISREEFEEKLGELRSLVRSYLSRGVVLYLGDLKWVSEFWSTYGEQKASFYSPVEHMIMELSRLLCGMGDSGKLWIMGIATFQTYMKCKAGRPSLETLWDLHPLTIPVGSLALSLNLESDLNNHFRSKAAGEGSSWLLSKAGAEKHLTCCADCVANFKREARSIARGPLESDTMNATYTTSSSLPSWLQQYKEEKRRETNNDQEFDKIRDLCMKWNSICKSVHKKSPHFLEKASNFSSASPCSSASISSNDKPSSKSHHQSLLTWPLIFEPDGPNQSPKERKFFVSESEEEALEPKILAMYKPDIKPDLLSNPNSSPNSASSSEASGDMDCLLPKLKEDNPENLEILRKALEKKVPWQRENIPEIARTILECRSGKSNNKGKKRNKTDREETWLFFLGVDCEGKEKIARELARIVFGSQDNFINIGLSSFSSTRADSIEEVSNKRSRDEHGRSYLERFADAVHENPSRVFFMEDVDQVDYHSQKGVKKAIESGTLTLPDGEMILFKDAIVIFSCNSFSSVSRASSPRMGSERNSNCEQKEEQIGDNSEEKRPCASLDLNIATEDHANEHPFADIGILDLVDKQVMFKVQVV